jgi:hypothetical protein
MQVISINAEHTKSPHVVAFNLDETPDAGVITDLNYGDLAFGLTGNVLIVSLPEGSTQLTAQSIKTLNDKLTQIAHDRQVAADKRVRMLQAIAANTGLPLN